MHIDTLIRFRMMLYPPVKEAPMPNNTATLDLAACLALLAPTYPELRVVCPCYARLGGKMCRARYMPGLSKREKAEAMKKDCAATCACKGLHYMPAPTDSALAELLQVARQKVVEVVFCWLRPYWPTRPNVVSCYLYPIQQAPIIGYGDTEALALARALVSVEEKR